MLHGVHLTEILTLLKKRWLTIVVFALAGLLVGAGIALSTAKTYLSTTDLFVAVQTGDATSANELAQGSSAAQLKVHSYVDVVSSSVVLAPVVKTLDLPYSAAQLATKVTATATVNSVIIRITVSDADPAEAARLANAIGASFTTVVVDDLETNAASGSAAVQVKTIEPAVASTTPASPNLRLDTAVGGLLGLLSGVAVAVLRQTLDTKIRTVADIASLGRVPVIGTIGFNPDQHKRTLVMQLEPRSPLAEAFRSLRTNLQFVDLEGPARCFVVSSSLPAEGKTTTTANLAIALAETGLRVALVDADLRRPRLAEVMGLDGTVGLTDVLISRAELGDVLQPWGSGELVVLPAGQVPPNPSELLGSQGMRTLLAELNSMFDYVLLDAPPLLPVTDAAVVSRLTSGVLLATAVGKSHRSQFISTLALLDQVGTRVLGVIVTMVPASSRDGYGYGGYYGHAYGVAPDASKTEWASQRRRGRTRTAGIRRSEAGHDDAPS